jgi:hypothetical protein
VGSFRGLYGDYSGRFCRSRRDLAPDGPVMRPGIFSRWRRRRFAIEDELLSAWVRPFESAKEARSFASTGLRAPDGSLVLSALVVVSCRASDGIVEFGVTGADVPLLLYYIELMRGQRRPSSPKLP